MIEINPSSKPCLFCNPEIQSSAVAERKSVFAIRDKYPVTEGHLLVIPKRHVKDWFSMTREERGEAEELLVFLRERIVQNDSKITGFNVGMNCGVSAGQTIMHAHIHLIPRRDGDVEIPRGGVRGCVPGMRGY